MKSGDTIGQYRVLDKLGEGGMGEVYLAADSRLKREVALKVLPPAVAGDPARLARFQREAELLASLNHPNIAQVHGLEESDGTTALVMELVDGDDLSRRIARGPVPLQEFLDIAKQIATALDAAHERGIVHRDLKPGNIKVRPDGTVKVLDFGLAKSLSPEGAGAATVTGISSPGLIVGTPAYMSPEQARGENIGPETDVWAFGVVLYEMLTGVSPFARPSATETLAHVLTTNVDEARLPTSTPASITRLIRRCLEKDPKRRWHHMGDARIEIEDVLAAPADKMTEVTSAPRTPITRRRMLSYGAASAALVASGLGAGILLDRRFGSAHSPPTFRRVTFRRGVIRSARFAPDGETILYGALWDDGKCRVHTVRVDGPESRALDLPPANVLAVSRSGELALALGEHEEGVITYGTLAQVSIAGGAPRKMAEDVKFADWSPDGADLAIVRRIDGRDQLQFPVGQPLVSPAPGQNTGLGFARISPDGTRVAFVQYQATGSLVGRVAIVDHSGNVTPLSPEYRNVHGLTWRGSEIVFTASDERPLFRALLAVTPGGGIRTITRLPGNVTVWDARPEGRMVAAQTDDRTVLMVRFPGVDGERDYSWLDASWLEDLSPDGKWLLFTEFGQGGGPESGVYLRATDGSAAVRLSAGRGLALSPDGQWALCASTAFPPPHLDLVPTGSGEPRRIPSHGLGYVGARWLPSGRQVVLSASEDGQRTKLFLHDLGTGRPTAITPEGVDSTNWAISPDGSTIAVRGLTPAIQLIDLKGSAPRDVPGLTGGDLPVGWVADGLLVRSITDPAAPRGEIYKVDIGTGQKTPWKNMLPRDVAGIMGNFRFRVTPDGQSQAYTWHRALSNLYLADGLP